MDNAEADELGKFRRLIDGADLRDLVPIIASVLDDYVDLIRGLGRGRTNTSVETAAALSAELHKRHAAPVVRAPTVGNA